MSRKRRRKGVPAYLDLGDLDEERRIDMIGQAAAAGNVVAFVTDADPGKAERYVSKLLERFPTLRVVGTVAGPVAGAITVKVAPAELLQ